MHNTQINSNLLSEKTYFSTVEVMKNVILSLKELCEIKHNRDSLRLIADVHTLACETARTQADTSRVQRHTNMSPSPHSYRQAKHDCQ